MNKKLKNIKTSVLSFTLIIFLLICVSTVGHIFKENNFPETNIVVIYILFVLLVSRLTRGYFYGILSAIIATFAFNYFFTAPYFSFSVYDPSYIITFTIMTITALITSALTSRVKQKAKEAKERERETRELYQLTNQLMDAKDMKEIADITTSVISNIIDCKTECIYVDENERLEKSFIKHISEKEQIHKNINNIEELKHIMENLNTGYYEDREFYNWPICGQENLLGILRIPKEKAKIMQENELRLIKTMIESTALAMDRFKQTQQKIKSDEEIVQERYRGNLLRSISHDLRTPLSGIMGTSEMLMDMTKKDDPRYDMEKAIYKDADWLRSLVENILNLTKLQEGRLILNKESEAVEEVIESAVNHISRRSPEYYICVKIPDELLLISMDAKLIEQVIINLLDNAIKHSNPEDEITIKVEKVKNGVKFSVIDNGEGILEEDVNKIFNMFYTSNAHSVDSKPGIGLGLTICEAIVKAHGGIIEASNKKDSKGAIFSFTLPYKEENNE